MTRVPTFVFVAAWYGTRTSNPHALKEISMYPGWATVVWLRAYEDAATKQRLGG